MTLRSRVSRSMVCLGLALAGCTATQPVPECTISSVNAFFGVPALAVLLEPVDPSNTGPCATLDRMQLGAFRYVDSLDAGEYRVGLKSDLLANLALGLRYQANLDSSNDCSRAEDCQGHVDPTASCVVTLDDGGLALSDGTPVEPDGGLAQRADGGAPFAVDVENHCEVVLEPIPRVDPSDPMSAQVVQQGLMPRYPTQGLCEVREIPTATVRLPALVLLDGGLRLPSVTHSLTWRNFRIITTPEIAGTAFTADLTYVEGSCSAEYTAKGFWSGAIYGTTFIACEGNPGEALSEAQACDPLPNLDAGVTLGSGMAPAFVPRCDTKRGICVPSVDYATLTSGR